MQAHFTRNFLASSLRDVAEAFTKATGVRIEASSRVADDMVILSVKDMSYSETMMRVATHFGFAWEARSDRYLLIQSDASVAREAKLLAKEEVAHLAMVRETAKKEATLPQDDLSALKEKYRAWHDAEPKLDWDKIRQTEKATKEDSPEREQYDTWYGSAEKDLGNRLMPDYRAVCSFLNGLDDATWQRIASGSPITFCTRPRANQTKLLSNWLLYTWTWAGNDPAEADPAFQATGDDVPVDRDFTPHLTSVREGFVGEISAVSLIVRWEPNEGFLRLRASETGGYLSVDLVGLDGDRRPMVSGSYALTTYRSYRETGERHAPAHDYSKDAVLGRTVVLPEMARLFLSSSAEDHKKVRAWLLGEGDKIEPLNVIAAPLRTAIADSAGVSVISDAFDYGWPPLKALAQMRLSGGDTRKTVGDHLDGLKQDYGQEWAIDHGWLTLRTTEYPWWRVRQMPRPVYARVKAVEQSFGEWAIDDLAAIATSATDMQFDNSPADTIGPFARDAQGDLLHLPRRLMLRFWAGLGAGERQVLMNGGALPLNGLRPDRQKPVLDLLRAATPTDRDLDTSAERLDPPDPGEDRFDKPVMPFDWTEFIPPRAAPVAVSLTRIHKPGFYYETVDEKGKVLDYKNASPSEIAMIATLEQEDTSGKESDEDKGERFGRRDVVDYLFRIHLAGRTAFPVRLSFSRKVPNSLLDLHHPPDDVKALIRRKEEMKKHPDKPGD